MKYKFKIPPTRRMGSYTTIGRSSYFETASENALWDYNNARDHDGLPMVDKLPDGTTMEEIQDQEGDK